MSVKDWLWRLDSTQRALEALIPESFLWVLLTVKMQNTSSSEEYTTPPFGTFPFGRVLTSVGCSVPGWDDEHGRVWFSLGCECLPCVVCWDLEGGMSLQESLPREALGGREDVLMPCFGWSRVYYVKRGDKRADDVDFADLAVRLSEVEGAILECCDRAPESVLGAVGNLAHFDCWSTALYYLAMKRTHPVLSAWGKRVTCPPAVGTWAKLNDYAIMLSPDLRAATGYAFDALRHIAESGGGGEAVGETGRRLGHQPKAALTSSGGAGEAIGTSSTDKGVGASSTTEATWSKPMSKTRMMGILGLDSYKTFNAFADRHGIRQAGNRKTWQLRLDGLDQATRHKFEST